MTFYNITCLVAGLFHLLLTVFVVSRDIKSKANRAYAVWGFSLALWNLAAFIKLQVPQETEEPSVIWIRLIHLGLVFLPVGIFHLCLIISEIKNRQLLPVLYSIHIALAFTVLFGDLYIERNVKTYFGWFAQPGPAFIVYSVLYAAIAIVTIRLLYRRQKRLQGMHRVRLRALLLGYGLLVAFGTHDLLQLRLLPDPGLEGVVRVATYPFTNVTIYPLANLAAIFYGLVVAYSVLQHQLLDIHVGLGQLAAQVVRVLFMFLVGLVLLLIASLFDPIESTIQTNLYPYVAALCVLLATSLFASFFFPRFFGKGEEYFERKLLGDQFEYQDKVRRVIGKIKDLHDPTKLLAELQELLVRTMGLRSYQIILLDENTRGFNLFDSYPMQTDTQVKTLNLESPIFRHFKTTGSSHLACSKAYSLPGETDLERRARVDIERFDPEVCFPLVSGDETFGLLLLGSKETNEPYTPSDLVLIKELVHNLRLVIDQIRLKNQIHLAQEQEMLGRMSRGLAHDLNNLLTPVQTCLQLVESGVTDKETLDEIMPMAINNIETIRSYVNEALFFSRNHSLNLKRVDLNETVKTATGLLSAEAARKSIKISIDGSNRANVKIDEVLIQRLICNLLSNAIDATPEGNSIWLGVVPLPRTERSREWFRMTVKDSGEGISPENLKRVFMPYFSTKNTGDRRRGFGLGLAIARKIVHLHGGNMVITSENGEGTTVQVDLPSQPLAGGEKDTKELAIEFAT